MALSRRFALSGYPEGRLWPVSEESSDKSSTPLKFRTTEVPGHPGAVRLVCLPVDPREMRLLQGLPSSADPVVHSDPVRFPRLSAVV